MKTKKAAMEMSVGTIVTVVLLMAVLILGIFLVQKIFKTSENSIDQIDRKVNAEIEKLFTDNEEKKLIIYPEEPVLKQGKSGGIGLSIRNTERGEKKFLYSVNPISNDCDLTPDEANSLIALGKEQTVPITLASGNAMDSAILVKFRIDESDPLCIVRYQIDVTYDDGNTYTFKQFDMEIIS